MHAMKLQGVNVPTSTELANYIRQNPVRANYLYDERPPAAGLVGGKCTPGDL